MTLMSRLGRAFAAITACAAMCLASQTNAQCIGYSIAPGMGTFVAGTTDIGLHADDATLAIALPFNVSFYGTSYSNVTVSSNGTLQFTTASAAYTNNCLPSATFAGPTILPFWDDLYTADTGGGQGIFTDLSGAPGSRVFVIEWRTVYCCGNGAPINDFEVKFYENSNNFDVVYSTPMSDRANATIGCQMDGAVGSPATQYVCNTAGPTSGTSLTFLCVGSATSGACCTPSNLSCLFTDAAGCAANSGTFSGIGTACATANCPSPGACCSTTGTCTQALPAACATAGGTYSGNSTSCAAVTCPTGACCVPATLTCVTLSPAGCTAQNGGYQGDNSSCAIAACPFGACCVFCAGCTVLPPAACTALSGAYNGDGSTCAAVSCSGTGTNLVANGDFESGSFSGWTQFGDLGFTAVNTGAWVGISPHGGTYEAHFGPTGTTGGIQQNLTANPGDRVTISFWYASLGTPSSFSADFDGQNLVSFTNDLAHQTWTQFVFSATVANANPLLSFTTFNPPSYIFLDDISICVGVATTGGCCNNTTGVCSSTTQANCPSGSTFQGVGTGCSPNPCPQPPAGVCCRGSTCTTTITSAANCTASLISGQTAGAFFATATSCNVVGNGASPCCYANYNKANGITVQDIFDFLNDWFAGSRYANVGGNGNPAPLAVQNIFDFLNAWFAGGC